MLPFIVMWLLVIFTVIGFSLWVMLLIVEGVFEHSERLFILTSVVVVVMAFFLSLVLVEVMVEADAVLSGLHLSNMSNPFGSTKGMYRDTKYLLHCDEYYLSLFLITTRSVVNFISPLCTYVSRTVVLCSSLVFIYQFLVWLMNNFTPPIACENGVIIVTQQEYLYLNLSQVLIGTIVSLIYLCCDDKNRNGGECCGGTENGKGELFTCLYFGSMVVFSLWYFGYLPDISNYISNYTPGINIVPESHIPEPPANPVYRRPGFVPLRLSPFSSSGN